MNPIKHPTENPNSTLINSSSRSFEPLPLFDITFRMQAKVFRQEGDLKYEYNPFRNIFSVGETIIEDGVPVVKEVGKLKDFRTTALGFSLNNPVEITVQPSYDGTVNLILNDDKNPPRLINSRFTPIEDKRYKIIDRRGNNDTNIYKEQFIDRSTRLFKTSENIPFIKFNGISEGGNLPSGNYVFYLKYIDADGNESDIITESGIISCHMGKINDPYSIRGGLINENSGKIIKFNINNIDISYDYLSIYYSRTTGDYGKEPIVKYYKLRSKKSISNSESLEIIVTGLDAIDEISVDELNIQYNIVDRVKTQAQVQNMLFLGNIDKPTIPHKDLEDLSLRIYPTVSNDKNIGFLNQNYNPITLPNQLDDYEYYNTVNVYKYTGYWNKEIYRLGIVYVLHDDTVSPVFNIRGVNGLKEINSGASLFENRVGTQFTYKPLYDEEGKRAYIEVDDEGFLINSSKDLENGKGVIRINYLKDSLVTNGGVFPLAIDFNIETEILEEMYKYAKGFFFVRQKRIPTILAQGVTIGVDETSDIPTLKANVTSAKGNKVIQFFTESFIDKSRLLTHDFTSRIITNGVGASTNGILSPEVLLKKELYNNLFTGANFNVSLSSFNNTVDYFEQDVLNPRHFYIKTYLKDSSFNNIKENVKLTLIEDNQPLRYSGSKQFSTRAGIPEEAWRVNYFGIEDKSAVATNLIRGSYTGFIGQEGFTIATKIVDIHTPGYNYTNMREYFLVRFNSSDSFYAISNRYDMQLLRSEVSYFEELNKVTITSGLYYNFKIYRGDCFINTVTARIQRNFQDPDVPISDTIVDSLSWKDNYKGFTQSGAVDNENLLKINRNDVNAIEMGHWATFKVCSNINLAYRVIDESNSAEYALTGTARSFFPLSSMSTKGENKIPESTLFNAGYNITVPQKFYFPTPDVPYIKNIFDTRIMFSDLHITDAFRNGYRIFQGLAYKDVTRQYGGVVKIFDMESNLLVVFEKGIGIFPINEKAILPGGETGDIFIKGAGVLPEKPNVVSDIYGSSWQDSVLRTKNWIYGVDTVAKKIWRTNGKTLELISDFKIQKFLNDNILLSDDDKKPMVGLKNVKTHYNAFKDDVMFTFYDSTRDDQELSWSICYNEITNNWTTRYSWIPLASESISNVWFSFDRLTGKRLALPGYTNNRNDESVGITLIGKTETFDKDLGATTITRTEENGINIVQTGTHVIGTFAMKGYDYYDQYILNYVLEPGVKDNDTFLIVGDELIWPNTSAWTTDKYSFELQVTVQLYSLLGGVPTLVSQFNDIMGVKVARNYIWANSTVEELLAYDEYFSTWFWKHGQAGIFDIQTEILPTKWYGRQELFEYEFVVVDIPSFHKIINNLKIISNNAEPHSFEFTISGDAFIDASGNVIGVPTSNPDNRRTNYQLAKDIRNPDHGRLRGNMSYMEDFWNVEVKPFKLADRPNGVPKEVRVRDKFCIIRVRYNGEKLAIITALQTMYTQSYT